MPGPGPGGWSLTSGGSRPTPLLRAALGAAFPSSSRTYRKRACAAACRAAAIIGWLAIMRVDDEPDVDGP